MQSNTIAITTATGFAVLILVVALAAGFGVDASQALAQGIPIALVCALTAAIAAVVSGQEAA